MTRGGVTSVSIWIPIVVIGGYAALVVLAGVGLAMRAGGTNPLLVAAALGALHLGYGLGMLRGLGDLVRPRR